MPLLLNRIRIKNQFFLKAEGISMSPLFTSGDIAYYKKTKFNKIKTNDIIIVRQKKIFLTHRVIYKAKNFLITKGDNNIQSDGKMYPKQIVGRVYQVKRGGKIFRPEDFYLLQSTLYLKEIVKVKRLLEKEKINCVFLKGLPLHLYLEKAHPARIYADCDILVAKNYKNKIHTLFLKEGYLAEDRAPYKHFRQFLSSDFKEVQYSKTVNGFPINLDIHFKIGLSTHLIELPIPLFKETENELTEEFIKNKKVIKIHEESFPILNNKNLILYLLIHFYTHNWIGIHRLEFIAQVAQVFKNKINWEEIFSLAKKDKCINFLIPSLYLLDKYFSISLPYRLLKKKYPYHVFYSLTIFKKLFNEKALFDSDIQMTKRLKKAAIIFLFYEETIFKKLVYFSHPKLLAHLISYILKLLTYKSR